MFRTCSGSLVFHELTEHSGVKAIGVFPETSDKITIRACAPSDAPALRNACFSSAPLEKVTCLSIYRGSDGSCRGILFEYDDGSRQTVGQCRIGVDMMQKCFSPARLWYLPTTVLRPYTDVKLAAVKVDVASASEDSYGNWHSCEMTGRVEMWYTGEETRLNVIQ